LRAAEACRPESARCSWDGRAGRLQGGFSKEISAGQATRVLEQVTPAGAIAQARHELAVQFLEDLRNRDT
jgi:hypothetical protein